MYVDRLHLYTFSFSNIFYQMSILIEKNYPYEIYLGNI